MPVTAFTTHSGFNVEREDYFVIAQVTRDQLRGFIGHAVAKSEDLYDEEAKKALLDVAEKENFLAVGSFWVDSKNCGCPLAAAGITDATANLTDFGHEHAPGLAQNTGAFYRHFDSPVVKAINSSVDFLRVVD